MFTFVGFLPARGQEREAALRRALAAPGTQLLFEGPHRIERLAAALAEAAPRRALTLCRELTKQFETVATMAAGELPGWLDADTNRRRGEFVLVLHAEAAPPPAAAAGEAAGLVHAIDPGSERTLRILLRELPLKQAVALAAEIGGAPRKALYALALAWREGANLESDDDHA